MKRRLLASSLLIAAAAAATLRAQGPQYPITVDRAGEGPVHLSAGLSDAVGQDSDSGEGEVVPEPVRPARVRHPRSRSPRRIGRAGIGPLRSRWRPAGRHAKPASGRKDADDDPVVHRRADPGSRQHAHSQRPYRRQRLLREAGRADLRAGESPQRDAASAAARQRSAGSGARDGCAFRSQPTVTTRPPAASRP